MASANARAYDMTDTAGVEAVDRARSVSVNVLHAIVHCIVMLFVRSICRARDDDAVFEAEFEAREFPLLSAPALHWDNPKKTDWLCAFWMPPRCCAARHPILLG